MFRDGYFYPGDMAIRRADGNIRIIGRVADVVNFEGFKLAVGPLEQAIRDALEVDEVCAFSAVTKKGQDELLIAIQARDRKLDADLQERVREIVLAHGSKAVSSKLIRLFLFPRFPREETGMRKTKRAVLRQKMLAEIDAMA
jgi:acyl-coenzyme A synthetase/AMP-(fatty) acid ligase